MTRQSRVGDSLPSKIKSIVSLNNNILTTSVQDSEEGAAYSAIEPDHRPKLPAYRHYSKEAGAEYAVEGPGGAGEWLVSARSDVVDLEVWR